MPNAILTKMVASADFTITLNNLANSTTAGQQSTLVSNSSNYPAALVFIKFTTGASAPTAGSVIEVFLLRSNGTIADDGAGATNTSLTIENAPLLGTIVVLTNGTNKALYGVFDTAALGPLGGTWGIALRNQSGQTSNSTAGNFAASYQYYYSEVQ